MLVIGCVLLGQRALNVMVPRQLGIITDSLMNNGHPSDLHEGKRFLPLLGMPARCMLKTLGHNLWESPWLQVSLYCLYRFLQSGSGLPALKDYLWISIVQY